MTPKPLLEPVLRGYLVQLRTSPRRAGRAGNGHHLGARASRPQGKLGHEACLSPILA